MNKKCSICKKLFKKLINVVVHLRNIHKLTEEEILNLIPRQKCQCKCGLYANCGYNFISGHYLKGKKQTEEYIKKRINARLNNGYKHSEETKRLIGIANLGKNKKGHIKSEKTKELIRQANLGKRLSNETKELLKKANLGRKHTNESKKRMSISQKEIQNREEVKEANRQRCIRMLKEGKLNIGWPQGESYPEKCYREHLEKLGYIKGIDFFQETRIGKYSLDFTFRDKMIDFEIDGKQHNNSKSIEHDKNRDKWLKEQGWTIIRLPAKQLLRKVFVKNFENGYIR